MSENGRRQRGFYFDQRYCTACKACQIACKDLHDLPVGVSWRRVLTFERGRFPQPRVFHLSLSCNHCQRPPCVHACSTGAVYKREEDGVVVLDVSLCTGCGSCTEACPYGAIQVDPATGKAGKCDLCVDLIAKGEQPACVGACTLRVLHFGWLDELPDARLVTGPGLPDPGLTGPSTRVYPHRDADER